MKKIENWIRYMISVMLLIMASPHISAQTVKVGKVSAGEPYVDHVALLDGSADHDLLVKFLFNEVENTMTVSLLSYKKLFVFQENVRYRTVSSFHKMQLDKLPYVAEAEDHTWYKFMKPLRRSIKPKRKHVFQRWIEVDGLQMRPVDYKMVNDYVEQTFDVTGLRNQVTITLRDILLMNECPKGKKIKYELYFQKDLNRRYEIVIMRDPCFGKEEQIKGAALRLEALRTSYSSLKEKFHTAVELNTPESTDLFNEMKTMVQEQFPREEKSFSCFEIQNNVDEYNAIVDSVRNMEYHYVYEEESVKVVPLPYTADYILSMARKIDSNVSRWLLSDDEVEKKDLIQLNVDIIQLMSAPIAEANELTEKQVEAIRVFHRAESYFNKVCLKK